MYAATAPARDLDDDDDLDDNSALICGDATLTLGVTDGEDGPYDNEPDRDSNSSIPAGHQLYN